MRKAYQCLQHRLLAAVDLRVGDMVGLWSLYGANGKKIFISMYGPRSSTASIIVT